MMYALGAITITQAFTARLNVRRCSSRLRIQVAKLHTLHRLGRRRRPVGR
jgi:hypothetical protein